MINPNVDPHCETNATAWLTDYLESCKIQYETQVHCGVGIADVVTTDAVYEVKGTLFRETIYEAIGQVMLYRSVLGLDRKAVIVGYRTDFIEKVMQGIILSDVHVLLVPIARQLVQPFKDAPVTYSPGYQKIPEVSQRRGGIRRLPSSRFRNNLTTPKLQDIE